MGYHPWGHKHSDTSDQVRHSHRGGRQRETDRGEWGASCWMMTQGRDGPMPPSGNSQFPRLYKTAGVCKLFLKGSDSKTLSFAGPSVSGVAPVAAGRQTQTAQECTWLCSHRLFFNKVDLAPRALVC